MAHTRSRKTGRKGGAVGGRGRETGEIGARIVGPALAVAALIGLAGVFRGLYFLPQQMYALLAACGVLTWALAVTGHWATSRIRSWVDWAAIAVWASYLVACFSAVRPEAAIQAWLLRGLYLAVFFAVGELSLASSIARYVLIAGLALGGLVDAVTGLIAAGGVPLNGAFVGGRMYTLLQYPDAAAAYIAATMLVVLGARLVVARLWLKLIAGAMMSVMLFVFTFALSRGAALVFILVLIAFLIALGRTWVDGLVSVWNAGLAVGASAIVYLHGLHRSTAGAAPGAPTVLGALAVLLVTSTALNVAWEFGQRTKGLGGRILAAALGVVTLSGAGLALLKTHSFHGLLTRLGRLSSTQYNAWARLRWARDGLRMVARRPLFGWGGGGWAAAYHAFQSYNYSSTQVHNNWIQVMVSTGAVGLLCWLSLVALVAWSLVVAYRRASAQLRPMVVALGGAAAMLIGHSSIDFTLSLGSASLGLWTIFGLVRSWGGVPEPVRQASGGRLRPARPVVARPWFSIGLVASVVAAVVLGTTQLIGIYQLSAAAHLGDAGNLNGALSRLNATIHVDPWSSGAYIDLGEVEWALGSQTTQQAQASAYVVRAGQAFQRAVALDPYNFSTRQDYANYLEATGRDGAAVQQLSTALGDAPFVTGVYDALAQGWLRAAVAALEHDDSATAQRDLGGVTTVAITMEQRSAGVPAPAKASGTPFPPASSGVDLAEAESLAIQGDWTQAASGLAPLVNEAGPLGAEANLWLGLIDQRQGRTQQASQELGIASGVLGSNYAGELNAANSVIGKLAAQ